MDTVCVEYHSEGIAFSYIPCVDTDHVREEVDIIHGKSGAKARTHCGEASFMKKNNAEGGKQQRQPSNAQNIAANLVEIRADV